jgi:uncharacterized membrane protein YphA (DoxX/SURF4 family)
MNLGNLQTPIGSQSPKAAYTCIAWQRFLPASSTTNKGTPMIREQPPAVSLFAIGLMGLGTLSVIYHDFAFDWQPVPVFHPGREVLAVLCGSFMIAASVALLFRATAAIAIRALFPFLLAWQCLKIPALIAAPGMEAVWLGFGEIAMLLAGGWVLLARLSGLEDSGTLFSRHITGNRGITIARMTFGLALLPVGLSHIFYVGITASLVPSWLPFRVGLAYLTGVGQMACGLGVLFSVFPRAAALVETGMLALFAFLVWGPDKWIAFAPKTAGIPAGPRFPLTAFFITWVIGASALLVATNTTSKWGGQLNFFAKPPGECG